MTMQAWQVTVPRTIPLELQQWCRDVFEVVSTVEHRLETEHTCAVGEDDILDLATRLDEIEARFDRFLLILGGAAKELRFGDVESQGRHAARPIETVGTDKV